MSFFDFISNLSIKVEGVFGTLSILVTLFIFIWQQIRLIKVQKQQTYQRLELASNELFRFAAANAGVLIGYHTMEKDPSLVVTDKDQMIADNHIYQTLNLFEMAARLREATFFEDKVFGSWVIWYYDMLESWYFRHQWPKYRPNYTTELRRVFDKPIKSFDPLADDTERKRQFFAHVAKELKCPLVRKWLDASA